MAIIIPPQAINNPQSADLYANFLWLKYQFGNGCVYDYNHYQLSLKVKKSFRFIKRTVDYALKMGWCVFHGKNLIFKNRHKQNFGKFKNTFLIKGKTISEIKLELKSLIIKNKLKQCAFVSKVRSDIQFPKNLIQLKRAKASEKKLNYRSIKGEMTSELRISYKGLGKALGCGETMAFKVMQKLCEVNKFKKKRNATELYSGVTKSFFNCFIQGIQTRNRYFFKKGNIYRTEMNSYTYPV